MTKSDSEHEVGTPSIPQRGAAMRPQSLAATGRPLLIMRERLPERWRES
jgi:hypothetical protein